LVLLVIVEFGLGIRRRIQWAQLRQLRVGALVVDRRLHRVAVVVLI
jgi:hypothetical protein